jgi:uncharacterized BrkB/YihY/UPF0761 family membrane protein
VHLLTLCYHVVKDVFYRFLADDGWAIASHIALSALMSLLPFLILVTALGGFLFGSRQLADPVADILLQAWPTEVATPISGEIRRVLLSARISAQLGNDEWHALRHQAGDEGDIARETVELRKASSLRALEQH